MSHEIHTELVEAGGAIDALSPSGVLGAELIAHEHDGKTLIEFVLPDRFPGVSNVPFKASWWVVDPGEITPEDRHEVQEMWFVGQGSGDLALDGRQLRIRAGQAIHIPPRATHRVRAIGTEELSVFSIWW